MEWRKQHISYSLKRDVFLRFSFSIRRLSITDIIDIVDYATYDPDSNLMFMYMWYPWVIILKKKNVTILFISKFILNWHGYYKKLKWSCSYDRMLMSNRYIHLLNTSITDRMYHKASFFGGARGVIVVVVGNEHGDTSSNPGRDWLHFT